jgi:hypothetical protein
MRDSFSLYVVCPIVYLDCIVIKVRQALVKPSECIFLIDGNFFSGKSRKHPTVIQSNILNHLTIFTMGVHVNLCKLAGAGV